MVEVGASWVTLMPSARGFSERMTRELRPEVARAGRRAGTDLGEAMARGLQPAMRTLGGLMSRSMAETGRDMGAAVARGTAEGLRASTPVIERAMSQVQGRLTAASRRDPISLSLDMDQSSVDLEFQRITSRLDGMSRSRPVDLRVDMDTSQAMHELATTTAGLVGHDVQIGVDFNHQHAVAALAGLTSALSAWSAANPVYLRVDVSTAQVAAQLATASAAASAASAAAGSSAGSAFGGAWVAAAATAIAAGAGMVVGAAAFIGVKTAVEMENAEIAFTTMLGSGEAAMEFLDDLKKFAAATPFEFPELQTAASSLISVGISAEDVIPIMRTLGDTTAGMGTGSEGIKRATVALQQMNAAQRITGEDLNQLRDAGIPVYDLLAAATGKSKQAVVELAQAGKLGKTELDQLMNALKTGEGLERFTGLMEKQSQSLGGMFSTLKDQVQMALGEAFQQNGEQIKRLLEALVPAVDGFVSGFAAGLRVFFAVTDFMIRFKEILLPIGGALTGAVIAFTAWTVAVKAAAAAQAVWNAVTLANPIMLIVMAIAAVVGALVVLYQRNEAVRNAIQTAWAGISAAFQAVWAVIQPIFAAFWGWITGTLWPAIQGLWTAVVQPVFAAIGTFISWVWQNVIFPALNALWTFLSGVLFPVLGALWTGVVQPVFSAIGTFISWVWSTLIKPALDALWWVITAVLAPALQWLWANVVSPVFQWVGDKISSTWTTYIQPALSAFAGWVTGTLVPAINNFWPVVRNVFQWVGDKISATWTTFVQPAFAAMRAGVTAVRDTFEVMVDAIGRTWDSMREKVQQPIRFVVNDVIRDKLVHGWNEVADKVGLPKWAFKGFEVGGWTGPGRKYDVAGVVHADEFVVRKESRAKIERRAPGLLDAMNQRGAAALEEWFGGYARGGRAMPNARTKPWPRYIATLVTRLFPEVGDIYGQGNRPIKTSYHHTGDALDLMVGRNRGLGDRIAAWGVKNWGPLLLDQIIWYNRIKTGGAWRPYSHPFGSNPTLRHEDHPHFSFSRGRMGNPASVAAGISAEEVQALLSASQSGGGGFIENPMAILAKRVIAPIMAAARAGVGGMRKRFGENEWVGMGAGYGTKMIDAVHNFINQKIDSLASIGLPSGAGVNDDASVVPAGSGVQRWAPLVQKALSILGLNPSWLGVTLKRMQQESGGNPRAINNWDCLPVRSLILTRRGWLHWSDVVVGDETIGYNADADQSEWTRITAVHHFDSAPTVRIGNKRWAVEATGNHRWLVENRTTGLTMRETTATGSRDTIILAAEAETGDGLPITLAEASLLGWIAGDGNVERGRRGPSMSVSQTKREHFDSIEAAFSGSAHARYEYPDRTACVTWRLEPSVARDLIARVGHPKDDAEQIVRGMSAEQRAAWLDAMIRAEGSSNGEYTVVYQCDGPVREALKLAIYLSGYRPSESKLSGKEQWAPCYAHGLTRPRVGPMNRSIVDAPDQEVWCVTTDLGTWTAQQDGQIFLTGNSNARRGTPSKGLMQVIDPTFRRWAHPQHASNIWDPLSNILASMRYAMARYGSLPAGYGRKGGYADGGRVVKLFDTGGVLEHGDIGINLSGKPEAVLNPAETRNYQRLMSGTGAAVAKGGDTTITLHAVPMDHAGDVADAVTWALMRADATRPALAGMVR